MRLGKGRKRKILGKSLLAKKKTKKKKQMDSKKVKEKVPKLYNLQL